MTSEGAGERSRPDGAAAPPSCALIIGCGYLGAVAARLLAAAGCEVWATTRSRDRWTDLRFSCARLFEYDVRRIPEKDVLPVYDGPGCLDVFVMLTPSAIVPAMDTGGYRRLIEAIGAMAPRRAVLVSSTGVYGEQAGGRITAETPPQAPAGRGQQLVSIENEWLAAGTHHRVCRLAGIYGPGRVIGRDTLINGDSLPGTAQAWLNLIHVEDAADLVIRCAGYAGAHDIELGSDGHPVSRGTYYATLASLLGVAPPRFDRERQARSGSKRCDPGSTMQRLSWSPRYRDYRAGLVASLERNGAAR